MGCRYVRLTLRDVPRRRRPFLRPGPLYERDGDSMGTGRVCRDSAFLQ